MHEQSTTTLCKICGSPSHLWGVVDFNKNCEERNGLYLAYTGEAVYYHKCDHCNFIFTIAFDSWNKDKFMERIYNDEYVIVDPEYIGARSIRDAEEFSRNFTDKTLSIMDYGAGNSVFAAELKKRGYSVDSWDPMWGTPVPWAATKRFDLITSYEVLEHTPVPIDTIKDMASWLSPTGKIFATTYVNDVLGSKRDATCWYLSPRNGHVCMYSIASLDLLFSIVGMKVTHYGTGFHYGEYA